MTRPRKRAVAAAVVLAAVAGVVWLDRSTRAPTGPRSSSYATVPDGLAAYADLLDRRGHPVTRLRRAPSEALPEPRGTIVLLDAALTTDDGQALRDWVGRGGTLVVGGADGLGAVAAVLDEAPRGHRPTTTTARPVRTGVLAPVREVRTEGRGAWADPAGGEPLLATADGSVLVATRAGSGRVLALADATPLQNQFLAEADNAALGRLLAGPDGAPVSFVESVHGYGVVEGLSALPERARVALGLLLVAALTLVLARARRLGPPEDAARPLPPPRRLYVDSLGAVLARTRDPAGAAPPLQEAARRALGRRVGRHADDPDLRAAAARTGLDAFELSAIFEPVRSEEALVRLARVQARLAGRSAAGPVAVMADSEGGGDDARAA
jgi:hypothetical protein